MKPSWDKNLISDIKKRLSLWKSNLSEYPDVIFRGGVSTSSADLYCSIENVIELLDIFENLDVDAVLYLMHGPSVNASLSGLQSTLDQYVTNKGTLPFTDHVVEQTWALYNLLMNIHPKADILPSLFKLMHQHEKRGDTEYGKLFKNAKEVIKSAQILDSTVTKQLEGSKKNLEEFTQSVQALKNLQITAEATAVSITSTKTNVDGLLTNLGDVEKKGEDLLDKLVFIKAQADEALSCSTQVALADSFKNRKQSLEKAQEKWIAAFCSGLLFFFFVTLCSLIFQKEFNLQPLIQNGHVDAWGVVSRLLIMSPVIWFTWFCVKRYGNNVSLIEDYAFKEASALAFVGYFNNMQDDPEMIKLLRESAIKNFAYSPSRLIGGDNPTSPLDEVISSAMKDKGVFDRLIKLLQVLKPNK